MHLTPHFQFSELSRTSHKQYQEQNLAEARVLLGKMYMLAGFAERVREIVGKPLIISSGYRCRDLNKAVGGSVFSQHLLCEAIDFTCKGLTTEKIFELIKSSDLKFEQLIIEQNQAGKQWIHVSIGSRKQCLKYDGFKFVTVK